MTGCHGIYGALLAILVGASACSPEVADTASHDLLVVRGNKAVTLSSDSDGRYHHDFEIENPTELSIRIDKVSASCGCVSAEVDRKLLEPGQIATLTASVRKPQAVRRTERILILYSTGSIEGALQLRLGAEPEEGVRLVVRPAALQLSCSPASEGVFTGLATVKLYSGSPSPMVAIEGDSRILGWELRNQWVEELTPGNFRRTQEWLITSHEAILGSQTLEFEASEGGGAKSVLAALAVTTSCRDHYYFSDDLLFLGGREQLLDGVTFRTFRRADSTAEIRDVRIDDPALTPSLSRLSGDAYDITITLNDNTRPAVLNEGLLKLFLTGESFNDLTPIEVPYVGFY